MKLPVCQTYKNIVRNELYKGGWCNPGDDIKTCLPYKCKHQFQGLVSKKKRLSCFHSNKQKNHFLSIALLIIKVVGGVDTLQGEFPHMAG
jgi:hypothetical protein